MANKKIRDAAKRMGVPLWAVADRLGVSEPTMTRKLRRELSEADTERIIVIMEKIKEERA